MKRMIGGWVLVCWLVVCSAVQAGEIERIQARGLIVVSLNPGTPPFCMTVEGQLMGIDVDLARLLADTLGVALKLVQPPDYGEQIPKLLAGETDIIMAAMTRTPERGLRVNFTDPYFEVSQAALVRRDKIGPDDRSYFDLVDIAGLRVGLKRNTTIEAFARALFAPEAVRPYASHPEAVEALLRGEVDATVHDAPFVRFWEKTHPALAGEVKALLAPTTRESYGFAIRKGDPDFLQWLNLFIAQAQNDGTLDLLQHRYLVEAPGRGKPPAATAALSRAQLVYSRFLAEKQALRERRHREAMQTSGAPY